MGSQQRCIYRVPSQLREVKPEAYRPRMLLIGPLTYCLKPKDYTDSRYIEYAMMEDQKVMYSDAFTKRPNGVAKVEEMKRIIEEEHTNIRASYAVSTDKWISDEIFKELILNDSIFIAEFIIRIYETREIIGDLIVDNNFYFSTVIEDLALLENQLPYFYLDMLLNPIIQQFCGNQTLDQVIRQLFSVNGMLNENTKFNHFTDMFRCVYKESLGEALVLTDGIVNIKNADKLSSVRVKFMVADTHQYSLKVAFEESCLIIPTFNADEAANIILRNVIAYEQCHDTGNAYATNYVHFMNLLITTDEDVKILTSGGVLTNGVGRPTMVLEMVNNLSTGALLDNSQYHGIAEQLNTHYRSFWNTTLGKLKRVYFSDLWTSTATLAAIILLLLTLAGTIASIKALEKEKQPIS